MRSKVLALVVVLVSLLVTGTALAGSPVHKVTGGGTTVFDFGTEQYGFVAMVDSAGKVKGQGEFYFAEPPGKFHTKMNCLWVDGNTAWLGMEITRTSDPVEYPLGVDLTWQVIDNGEGAGSPSDEQSYFVPTEILPFVGPWEDCTDMPTIIADLGPLPWTNGNIQVR
jgi:hypothetical protein